MCLTKQTFIKSLFIHYLVTIYKVFIRPYQNYGDVLYHQAFYNSFHEKMESIQFNPCLAITGAIRGTSREKIYQELGLGSLQRGTGNFVSFTKFSKMNIRSTFSILCV